VRLIPRFPGQTAESSELEVEAGPGMVKQAEGRTQPDRAVVPPQSTIQAVPETISASPPEDPGSSSFTREEAKRVFRALERLFEKQWEI
jgi:hypothetical protein